jgi:polyhydroxyalkanoate synthase
MSEIEIRTKRPAKQKIAASPQTPPAATPKIVGKAAAKKTSAPAGALIRGKQTPIRTAEPKGTTPKGSAPKPTAKTLTKTIAKSPARPASVPKTVTSVLPVRKKKPLQTKPAARTAPPEAKPAEAASPLPVKRTVARKTTPPPAPPKNQAQAATATRKKTRRAPPELAQLIEAPPLLALTPRAMAQPLVSLQPKPQHDQAGAEAAMPMPDFNALSQNLAKLVEQGGKAAAAFFKPYEEGQKNPDLAEHVEDAVKTFGHVAEHWISDPQRAIEAQTAISSPMLELWSHTLRKMSGEPTEPVRAPDPSDKRFADPEWNNNPIYDFLRQAYCITTDWANDMVSRADTLEPFEREKAGFYLRQIAGAISPSNFIATNPELLRTTIEQSGENLVRGMQMFAEDLEAGKGQLKIRQSDASKFVLGRDMAATPGKVVLRNDLMELIQYTPTTQTVFRRPLIIVPPWINKFYVLDLNPEKSYIRWAVSQGLTVFLISWVNPDERHADKSFEDYMREGILAALDAIETSTGERHVSTVGYCVGGTLLAIALAYMAAVGDDRISSSTFLTTQVDFRDAGDLRLFVDQVRIKAIEEKMAETGYLEGSKMATAFNMLRPNELIWSYVVNNYLKGKEPMPFDLLAWNSDSTRMPAANHSFYLRNCYLENNLTQGRLDFAGKRLNLKDVKIPVYHLATKEDHIAPARSVFTGAGFFGGEVTYVLAGSGHIAGVVNPANKPKYQYWSGPMIEGTYEDWVAKATETPGTWWGDWLGWLTAQAPVRVPARTPGGGKLEPLCDAPGDYVRVRA